MNFTDNIEDVIDDLRIRSMLDDALLCARDRDMVSGLLDKARAGRGLLPKEAAVLLSVEDDVLTELILHTAGEVRKKIYGERLVLFAPIYISNHCVNDCEYCGFRSTNTQKRTKLTTKDIDVETKTLINMGHKRLLLECGEAPDMNTLEYVIEAIDTIYSSSVGSNNIRRVNVNIAPLDLEGFKRLKAADIGTYQLFQETYHRETYELMHNGPKANYTRQLFAHDRAFAVGINDIGLGVLFGLYDYRFEVIALLRHARYLEDRFGVGPHTVSVPRLRAAPGVTLDAKYQVSDAELLKIIAVIRLAMPYTGIILSTREGAELREDAFKVGVTQASTGSVATPGGYNESHDKAAQFTLPQFTLKDERSVKDFIGDILADGVLPSFCTACYRRGRTGEAFMDLAKPGDIEAFCSPNALLTFKEYIEDFAAPELLEKAGSLIERHLGEITDRGLRAETIRRLGKIEDGARDLFF